MKTARDENDKLRDGTLPVDPFEGETVSDDAPHILTVRDLLSGSASRARMTERHVYGTTGHHKLDAITGGLRPGDCWLMGADTSWGKSSWAIMLADENLKLGKRVLIVSAEDSEATYGDRLMCRRTRIPAQTMRDRTLTAEHHEAIAHVQSKAENLPVFIDARSKPVEWLIPRCKRAIREHQIDVIVFDYIQAFTCKGLQQDRRNAVTAIGRALTDIAKTAVPGGICGVMLSQLTPESEDAIPGKYSIRDSKDLTQMSEVTLLGFLAPKEEPDYDVRKGDRCIKVAKCKQGVVGNKITMKWDSEVACFDAVPRPRPCQSRPFQREASKLGDAYAGADGWGSFDNEPKGSR